MTCHNDFHTMRLVYRDPTLTSIGCVACGVIQIHRRVKEEDCNHIWWQRVDSGENFDTKMDLFVRPDPVRVFVFEHRGFDVFVYCPACNTTRTSRNGDIFTESFKKGLYNAEEETIDLDSIFQTGSCRDQEVRANDQAR